MGKKSLYPLISYLNPPFWFLTSILANGCVQGLLVKDLCIIGLLCEVDSPGELSIYCVRVVGEELLDNFRLDEAALQEVLSGAEMNVRKTDLDLIIEHDVLILPQYLVEELEGAQLQARQRIVA